VRERRSGFASRLMLVIALFALIAGCGLVAWGFVPRAAEAAPLPTPFVAGEPTTGVDATQADGLAPNRLRIPSLTIDAPLVDGAITWQGSGRTLEIPGDPQELTLFSSGASACADRGTVLIAGHVSSSGVHGALWPLAQIEPNAVVFLTCADGTLTTWRATTVEVKEKADFPQELFTNRGTLRAVIVTCGGPVMADGHYRDNIVVELDRVSPSLMVTHGS
jgi:hypothetical protein